MILFEFTRDSRISVLSSLMKFVARTKRSDAMNASSFFVIMICFSVLVFFNYNILLIKNYRHCENNNIIDLLFQRTLVCCTIIVVWSPRYLLVLKYQKCGHSAKVLMDGSCVEGVVAEGYLRTERTFRTLVGRSRCSCSVRSGRLDFFMSRDSLSPSFTREAVRR